MPPGDGVAVEPKSVYDATVSHIQDTLSSYMFVEDDVPFAEFIWENTRVGL